VIIATETMASIHFIHKITVINVPITHVI